MNIPYISMRGVRWAWTRVGLTITQKCVLAALASHADDNGLARPSISRLCEMTGGAERTVQGALVALSSMGLLERRDQAGRPTRYWLLWGAAEIPREEEYDCSYAPDDETPHPTNVVAYPSRGQDGRTAYTGMPSDDRTTYTGMSAPKSAELGETPAYAAPPQLSHPAAAAPPQQPHPPPQHLPPIPVSTPAAAAPLTPAAAAPPQQPLPIEASTPAADAPPAPAADAPTPAADAPAPAADAPEENMKREEKRTVTKKKRSSATRARDAGPLLKEDPESPDSNPQGLLDIWLTHTAGSRIPVVRDLTPARARLLVAAAAQLGGRAGWEDYCRRIGGNRFLRGDVKDFKVTLDWALKRDNRAKVLEGNYASDDAPEIGDETARPAGVASAPLAEKHPELDYDGDPDWCPIFGKYNRMLLDVVTKPAKERMSYLPEIEAEHARAKARLAELTAEREAKQAKGQA